MNKTPISIAEAYYAAFQEKNTSAMGKYLHPDVLFIGPLATMTGKEGVIKAAEKFCTFFKTLTIPAKFGSDKQAMVVYDLDCPEPIGHFRAAALLTVENNLITRLELFYDARPFEKKEIFSR